MCGISGIVYSNRISLSNEINSKEIKDKIKLICQRKLSDKDIINLAWKIKSNINFIKYVKNSDFKRHIKLLSIEINKLICELSEEIQLIDKLNSMPKYLNSIGKLQNLKDSAWFLDIEINEWVTDIEYLTNMSVQNIEDNNIILFKDISAIIRSVDSKLELRGRDSLGISIQVQVEKSNNLRKRKSYSVLNDRNSKTEVLTNYNKGIFQFTFKTFNKIGALGENTNKIKKMIKFDKLFNEIVKENIVNSALIVAHTRWASVGEVNIENTHPITLKNNYNKSTNWISSILNGDIYNYREFLYKNRNIKYEKNCTTDCLAISKAIISKPNKSFLSNKKVVDRFTGSFAIGIFGNEINSEIHIFKKGTQGLYIGFSDDRIMFASDVYGLIEYCRYFYPLKDNEAFKLSKNTTLNLNGFELSIKHAGKDKIISKNNLQETNITTRDIDRKDFKHFLEKEIFESYDISETTINRYIHYSNNYSKYSNYKFTIDKNQVPEVIIKNLKQRKIKKIILTGMGTCYTAGVAISNYMREILKKVNQDIIIETTIASEGSGFYLDPDMSDTLVIVIAQSGTTIDTNIYVKKAKERGALSIAIANKREGDVTFLVNGTLYIGEGRDIEISVPSTKTYTAQVLLGYIFTLYLLRKIDIKESNSKLFNREIEKLLQSPNLIQKTLNYKSINESIKSLGTKFLKYESWAVAYDDSENSICANEIRIKLSENCYQAIPYLTINKIIELKIKNSFITIISNKDINTLDDQISRIMYRNNFVVLINPKSISNSEKKGKKYNSNKFININFPPAKKYYSFLPSIISGQLLSYHLAKVMDSRSKILMKYRGSLINNINKNRNLKILEKNYKRGSFNIGISKNIINSVINNNRIKKSTKIRQIDKLILQSRRTIDTIKHQAKTITVGAVREGLVNNEKKKLSTSFINKNNKISSDFYDEIISSFSEREKQGVRIKLRNSDYIYLQSEILDEAHLYNIVNFVSEIEKMINKRNIIKLAQPYDLKRIHSKHILKLTVDNTKKKRVNTLNFSNFILHKNLNRVFHAKSFTDIELKYHFWTICISIFLIDKFIIGNEKINLQSTLRKKIKNIISRDLNLLANSIHEPSFIKGIKMQTKNIHTNIVSSANIKCLGSGINYNLAKFAAKKIMGSLERPCAFDILENHKHIDISAESRILIFLANIKTPGYQNDAFSEIEKILSHNNVPIIITNNGDNRFDNLNSHENIKVQIIKIPPLPENCNSFVNIYIVSQIMIKLQNEK